MENLDFGFLDYLIIIFWPSQCYFSLFLSFFCGSSLYGWHFENNPKNKFLNFVFIFFISRKMPDTVFIETYSLMLWSFKGKCYKYFNE